MTINESHSNAYYPTSESVELPLFLKALTVEFGKTFAALCSRGFGYIASDVHAQI